MLCTRLSILLARNGFKVCICISVVVSCLSNTKDRVLPQFQTPRRELKIRRAAVAVFFFPTNFEVFQLEMCSNTVLSVRHIF